MNAPLCLTKSDREGHSEGTDPAVISPPDDPERHRMKTHPAPDRFPTTIRIEAGGTAPLRVRADAYLQVRRGRVIVHDAPRWLADTMLPAQRRLVDGEGHHVTQRGWLHLHALTPTELVVHQPALRSRPWGGLGPAFADALRGPLHGAVRWLRSLWRPRAGLRM